MKRRGTETHEHQTVPVDVLYEDNHIIIINKKPSEIVQGDKTGDKPLVEITKEYIKRKYKKPGRVFLGVVHRIDRPVSGVVIFARTSKALTRLNAMLRRHEIKKKYWAVVKNKPQEDQNKLTHYLVKNPKQNKSYVVDRDTQGALLAELTYRIIGKSQAFYLLEVEIHTGRHHQIRAQLSYTGCPIKGDIKYKYPRTNPDASIHLHARSVEFIHPVNQEKIHIAAPSPADPIWDYFESKQKNH